MKEMIDKGQAERVPDEDLHLSNGRIWYIPHHGVYHPQKPDKIRVVFDASAEFKGESLTEFSAGSRSQWQFTCSGLRLPQGAQNLHWKEPQTFLELFGSDPAKFVKEDFYVDDGLKSVPSAVQASALMESTKCLLAKGGFNLHKFISNSKKVIKAISKEQQASDIKELYLSRDVLPIKRALGVQWCMQSDSLKFRVVLKDKPLTRRGILSSISSI